MTAAVFRSTEFQALHPRSGCVPQRNSVQGGWYQTVQCCVKALGSSGVLSVGCLFRTVRDNEVRIHDPAKSLGRDE